MERVSYFNIFRRRWWVILICVVLSVVTVLLVIKPSSKKKGAQGQYEAVTVMLDTGRNGGGYLSLKTVAFVATLRPVTTAAAHILHYVGDPSGLLPNVSASADLSAGAVEITGTSADPSEAVSISKAFTRALLNYLVTTKESTTRPKIATLRAEIVDLGSGSSSGKSSGKKISDLQRQIAQLQAGAKVTGFKVIQVATAQPLLPSATGKAASGKSSSKILQSAKVRGALAVLLGLIIGAILSLIIERLDGRLRTTRSVTRASDLPVLGEIPELSRSQRKNILVADNPLSKGANAFRTLAAAITSSIHPEAPMNGNGKPPLAVLVTSAIKGEGKTTVASNLAAAYAEAGRSVIVIAGDLRDSDLHRRFKVADQPGLCEVLKAESGETLNAVRQLSGIDNLTVVGSGGPCERPGQLLASDRMRTLLTEARATANVVIIDTTGLLDEGDAVDLLPIVDAVVVVARPGQLKAPAAVSMGEILHRLRAPSPGVVVNGQTESEPGPVEPIRELEPAVELR